MRLPWVVVAAFVAVPTIARAAPPTAEALCGVIVDGKVETVVPAPDHRKLDKPISCAIQVKSGSADAASISVLVGGTEGASSFDVLAKGQDHEATLAPGSDYPTCKDFVIVARLYQNKKPVWEKKLPVAQRCAVAPSPPSTVAKPKPPADKPTPEADTDGTWADGELDRLPKDAQQTIAEWTETYIAQDHRFIESWPTAGVKIKGKLVTPNNLGKTLPLPPEPNNDLVHAIGIVGSARCADPEHNTGCHWGRWHANVSPKSTTEIAVYCGNDSDYGSFVTAVFTKKGKKWIWTAVGTYDTGEP